MRPEEVAATDETAFRFDARLAAVGLGRETVEHVLAFAKALCDDDEYGDELERLGLVAARLVTLMPPRPNASLTERG